MTLPNRLTEAMRSFVALSPLDDLEPHDYVTLEAAQDVMRDYLGREDRQRERTPKKAIQSRPKVKQDPPELTEAKKVVKWRSGGNCEARIVGVCLGRATNVHHRAGRGFDGCHDPALLLHVCGHGNVSGCHGYIEQNPSWAKDYGLRLPWGTTAAAAGPACVAPTTARNPGWYEGREVTG